MSDQTEATPLLELARNVPKKLCAEWASQWFEDGTPCGHSMAPVGKYLHDMADRIEELERELVASNASLTEQHNEWSAHSEAIAKQRNDALAENEKLRAVVDAAKQLYRFGIKRGSQVHLELEQALAALEE